MSHNDRITWLEGFVKGLQKRIEKLEHPPIHIYRTMPPDNPVNPGNPGVAESQGFDELGNKAPVTLEDVLIEEMKPVPSDKISIDRKDVEDYICRYEKQMEGREYFFVTKLRKALANDGERTGGLR